MPSTHSSGHRPVHHPDRQTLAEPQPEFLSIVPFTGEIEIALPDEAARRPRKSTAATSSANCRTPRGGRRRDQPAACSAPARRSATATCAAWASSTSTTLTTLEPPHHQGAVRCVKENRFTGVKHDYIRDDSHAFILREAIPLHRLRPLRAGLRRGGRRRVLRLHADRLRHAGTTPLDMSPQRDAVRVVRPPCAETCPTRALMPKPRVLQKQEVDESAHPVRHLRRCLPVRRPARG